MQGVFLDKASLDTGDLDFASLHHALADWRFHDATPSEDVRVNIGDAQVVISNKVVLDAATLNQAQKLNLICVAATGTNNVDLAAAKRLGITVCNVRAYATPSVAQHVFALILALYRRLPDYQGAVAAGRWQRSEQFCLLDFPIRELNGRTLGIVGYGELGQAVARLARAFEMDVVVAQRPGDDIPRPDRMPLKDVLRTADILSLHCPLTPETRNLIGAEQLALMKPDALLINTARGGIVDETALLSALRNGRLGGAGVDVLSEEPPVRGNPLLAPDIPNLIVTPHIAWAGRESRQRLLDQVAQNIVAYFQGSPRNVVV